MFKKRTSKKFKREKTAAQLLDLNVNSPRIMAFKSLGYLGKLVKYVIILVVLAGLAVGGVKLFRNVFLDNEEYVLKSIEVDTNGSFTAQRVVEETLIKSGATMFSIDLKTIETSLSALPEVESVSVKRQLPDKLIVTLSEHLPIAWLQLSDNSILARDSRTGLLVGKDGVLFKCSNEMRMSAKNLPVLYLVRDKLQNYESGEKLMSVDVMRAVALINRHKELSQTVPLKTVKLDNFYTLISEYEDDLLVYFGMYDHERQLEDLRKLRAHAYSLNKSLSSLDLRPENNIPGYYKDPNEIKVKPGQR